MYYLDAHGHQQRPLVRFKSYLNMGKVGFRRKTRGFPEETEVFPKNQGIPEVLSATLENSKGLVALGIYIYIYIYNLYSYI